MAKDRGTGQTSPNSMVSATRKGMGEGSGGDRTEGEVPGTGSSYGALLNERENKSNTRNRGPSRSGGAVGGASLPVVSMGARNTGRTG